MLLAVVVIRTVLELSSRVTVTPAVAVPSSVTVARLVRSSLSVPVSEAGSSVIVGVAVEDKSVKETSSFVTSLPESRTSM